MQPMQTNQKCNFRSFGGCFQAEAYSDCFALFLHCFFRFQRYGPCNVVFVIVAAVVAVVVVVDVVVVVVACFFSIAGWGCEAVHIGIANGEKGKDHAFIICV